MPGSKSHDMKQVRRTPRQPDLGVEEQPKAVGRPQADDLAAEALRANPQLAAQMGDAQRARAVTGLQKTHGNAAVQRMLQRQEVPEEEELQLKPASETMVQRQEVPEEEELQAKPAEAMPAPGPIPAGLTAAIDAERGSGQALDEAARAEMESVLGADFSGVRVHTGPEADALNRELGAAAFTTGRDIFFRNGMYQPGSSAGHELLAHELTHVVQQGGEEASGPLTLGPVGDAFEHEADQVAEQATGGEAAATASQAGAVQRGLLDPSLGT